ncbi:MAG: hypothetical protein AAF628_11450 [Planctomycetota bacterium]
MIRLLGRLFLLALLVAGVGYCQGWYTVKAGGGGEFSVSFDGDKAKADLAKGAEKVGEGARQVGAWAKQAATRIRELSKQKGGNQSVLEGRLVRVDLASHAIEVRAENGESVTLELGSAMIRLAGEVVPLHRLTVGDAVEITLRGGEAEELTVESVAARR